MDEGSLGVHEVEFVVKSGKGFGDGGGVVEHADSTLYFGQIAARNHRRWLVVDAHLIIRVEKHTREKITGMDRSAWTDAHEQTRMNRSA